MTGFKFLATGRTRNRGGNLAATCDPVTCVFREHRVYTALSMRHVFCTANPLRSPDIQKIMSGWSPSSQNIVALADLSSSRMIRLVTRQGHAEPTRSLETVERRSSSYGGQPVGKWPKPLGGGVDEPAWSTGAHTTLSQARDQIAAVDDPTAGDARAQRDF